MPRCVYTRYVLYVGQHVGCIMLWNKTVLENRMIATMVGSLERVNGEREREVMHLVCVCVCVCVCVS